MAKANLSETLRAMGVVGAGGAGFPTYVKAQAKAEFMLANGAECEPLLHKDAELMHRYPAEVIAGMRLMMSAVEAQQGKFGIKAKNQEAMEAIQPHAARAAIELTVLGDFYPSGDEYELVYTATGRLIPAGGLPLHVGCVVNNVETLYNVQLAAGGAPVTKKFLTICGAVKKACSFWAPLGTSFRELIAMAGGSSVRDFGVFVSGIMMGALSFDLDDVVTKTTCGLILLPKDHTLVRRKSLPLESMNRIGKSACDQCSYCTEFCPRYLLGYDVQPHKVMRSLGFTLTGAQNWNQWGELCCACGLCTVYACPEDLFPKEACDQAKVARRAEGLKYEQPHPLRVHPMKEYRRVPLAMLRKRLAVDDYEKPTPFTAREPEPASVKIKLKQHAGTASVAVVRAGETVRAGQPVGRMEEGALGAAVHASIDGRVTAVTPDYVEIAR